MSDLRKNHGGRYKSGGQSVAGKYRPGASSALHEFAFLKDLHAESRRIEAEMSRNRKAHSMLSEFEKSMVAAALRKSGTCIPEDLAPLQAMHPGIRELRLRNFISAQWEGPDWRESVSPEALAGLASKLQLRAPTADEKLQAALSPDELSSGQRRFVSAVYGNGPQISAATVSEARKILERKNPDELSAVWRKNAMDLLTMAGLAHKMRFRREISLTDDELAMLTLLRGSEKRTATMPGKEFDRILEAFEEPLQQKVIRGGFVGIKNYKPEIVKLWLHYTSSSPAYASLKAAARAEDEFHTLLDFLGIVAPKAHGRIEENCGMTKAKNLAPPERKNEDSMSSSRIALPDGTIIVLDAVWDGMGGHDDGSLASGIAKEIFEISSLAGWIKEPEDVRKLMILTDLAIIFEQISRAYKPEDPNLHDPLVIGNLRQQNSMGTTAVLCFQRGTELYVVNCGDSDFRLFASDVDYRHVVHDGSYDVRVQLQEDKELRALEDELRKNGRDPDKMDIYSRVALKEKARHLAEKKLSKDTEPPVSNVISAGLGGLAKYIHINGTTQWSKPVKVNGSAVKMLASDGVSDIVCHHESETLIMQSNGDLDLALKRIMALADHRSVDGAIFRLTCGCPDRQGKDDDKSLKLRFARAAS